MLTVLPPPEQQDRQEGLNELQQAKPVKKKLDQSQVESLNQSQFVVPMDVASSLQTEDPVRF